MAVVSWQLHEARNRLGDLVRRALREGPQRITRRGLPAVLVSEAHWNEITQKIPSFGKLLAECPLAAENLRARRPARAFRIDIAE